MEWGYSLQIIMLEETLRAVDRAYLLYDGKILVHGDADFLQNDSIAREKYLGFDF